MTQPSTYKQSKALYYPHTSFQDVGWLKASLLYWDGIRRIAPGGYKFHDSPEVLEAKDNDLIDDTEPYRYVEDAEIEFSSVFNSITSGDTLSQAVDNIPQRFNSVNNLNLFEIERIFMGKISESLCERLIETRQGYQRGENLYLPPDLGGLYMCVLSSVMSKRIGAPLITDRKPISVVGQEIAYKYLPNQSANQNLSSFLFELGFQLPAPIAMQLIDMKKVIKFHKDHGAERIRFREAVTEIVKEAQGIDDPNRLGDFIGSKKREVETAMTEYKKAQKDLGVDLANAVLVVGVPSVLNTLGSYLTKQGFTGIEQIITVGGLLFSVHRVWQSHQTKLDHLKKEYPLHYTLTMENELK